MKTRNKTNSKMLICLALVLVLITSALGYLTKGFTDWNYNNWLKKITTQATLVNDELGNMQTWNSPILRSSYGSNITYKNGKFHYTVYFDHDIGEAIIADVRNGDHPSANVVMEGATFANGRMKVLYDTATVSGQEKSFEFVFDYVLGSVFSAVIKNQEHGGGDPYITSVFHYNSATLPLPPSPTKEGYTFKGWFMDKACTIPYDGSPIYADTTLYAGWTINKHTVTFNADGGTAVATQTVDWNTAVTPLEPTKEGYLFLGWFIDSDTKYTGQVIKSNTTLTAHWEEVVYTITFIVDDETYITMEIPYGTRLVEAVEKANLQTKNILAVSVPNGTKQDVSATDFQIVSNSTVNMTSMSTIQEITTDWQQNSIYALLGITLVSIVACIPLMFKRKRKYNK